MRDEKSRQGVDFVWGNENDAATSLADALSANAESTNSVTDNSTETIESNIEQVSVDTEDSNDYSFFDDAQDTELYIGCITFGLNIIFLIMLIFWIANKCCCANKGDKPIMDYLRFLKRQNQDTERLEMAKNPDIRIERSESEKFSAVDNSKDFRVTPTPHSPR